MVDKVNYQQARRIRKAGFSSIFADQMLYQPTVLGAAKRAASLKLQSKMKGITEKFDPLNIARMMTFGSKFGPSILGKMTGRSKEDIEYFTGRLKPIAVKSGQKVTPVPKDGEQLVEGKNIRITGNNGMNAQLLKIYKLLKNSKDSDKKRRELQQDFAEEKALEADRRHKELLKKLEKLTKAIGVPTEGQAPTQTAQLAQSSDPTSMVEELLSNPIVQFLTSFLTVDAMVTGLLATGPMAALWAATQQAESADINNPGANVFANVGAGGLAFANYIDEKTGRSKELKQEQMTRNDERMRKGDSWEKKSAGTDAEQLKMLAPVIQNYEKMYKDAKGPDKKQVEVALNSIYDQRDALIKKIGGVDAPGERITGAKPTASKAETGGKSAAPTASPATATPASPAASTPAAAAPKTTEVGATPTPVAATSATPTTSTGNEGKLVVAMAENADAQLPKKKAEDSVTVNNMVSQSKKQSRIPDKLSELAVRNDEPTLLRMIMASTRLV